MLPDRIQEGGSFDGLYDVAAMIVDCGVVFVASVVSPRRYSDSSSSDEEQHSGTEDSDDSGRSDTESAHGSYRSERDESDASDHDSDL